MTSADLPALLARIEAAEGPDRELDAALMPFAGYVLCSHPWERQHPCWSPKRRGIVLDMAEDTLPFTRSIDAADALLTHLRLEWSRSLDGHVCVHVPDTGITCRPVAATLPLRLCAGAVRCEMERGTSPLAGDGR